MKYIDYIKWFSVFAICGIIFILAFNMKSYKKKYETERNNVEAYRQENSIEKNKALEYALTIESLRHSNDSIDMEIIKLKDSLKIKDKKIKYVQYQLKEITKTDSIYFHDTIFVEDVCIDTLLHDDWYSLNVKLEYPSNIIITPEFKSEQYTFIHERKEYDKTPSKVFFIRWFQKKHKVVEVVLEEQNPYIKNKQVKFIKVLKND
jgi:hypothetical protein